MSALHSLAAGWRRRELSSDARAGSRARKLAREAQRAHVRRTWPWLLAMWAMVFLPVPIVWLIEDADMVRGFALGAGLVGASALVWFSVVQSTGTAPVMMGDQAEQWTAQEVRRLGRGWRLINRFLLTNHGDIDHVALGPPGALVVETKWTGESWSSEYGQRRILEAVQQVSRSARQFRTWASVKRAGLRVHPIVVLWGARTGRCSPDECVRHHGDVVVVAGHHLREYVRALPPADHSASSLDEVWSAIDGHAQKRDAHESINIAVPLSAGEVLVRLGIFICALTVGFLGVLHFFTWTQSPLLTLLVGSATSFALFTANRRWPRVRTLALGAFAGIVPLMLLIAIAEVASLA